MQAQAPVRTASCAPRPSDQSSALRSTTRALSTPAAATTRRRNWHFFDWLSTSRISLAGNATASGSAGKPAPVPMSAIRLAERSGQQRAPPVSRRGERPQPPRGRVRSSVPVVRGEGLEDRRHLHVRARRQPVLLCQRLNKNVPWAARGVRRSWGTWPSYRGYEYRHECRSGRSAAPLSTTGSTSSASTRPRAIHW